MILIATKMNIHEHQAKEILNEFGAPVSKGVVILSPDEIEQKIANLNSKEFVLKAQIHAGGRGKAGGVKLIKNTKDLINEAKKCLVKFWSRTKLVLKVRKLKDFILKKPQI